ncbi:MAG: glycoside hydrolase family 31 protein [Hallella sp.]|uniref:TIM-barrel domain-containing protein n=1 Tax=Hallella sp. TaxID=2980186 RepID=UPI0025879D61|nr:TIM-barrel domain-containing protein [Hallella sp.]MDD7145940.1 glycoside hydrolase family 31 protein [Hallella sp.]
MNNYFNRLLLGTLVAAAPALAATANDVTGIRRINNTTAEVMLSDGHTLTVDFYGPSIFRLFQDNSGGIVRDPEASPEAKILTNNPRRDVGKLTVSSDDQKVSVSTANVRVDFAKKGALVSVTDLRRQHTVVSQTEPTLFERGKTTLTLSQQPNEWFYGGGVQNGRFSHRGEKIDIVNTNSWTDGGVCSPAPFYWSTGGYAVMCHTFKQGAYDFGKTRKGEVTISHDTPYMDVFVMVDERPVQLLDDYYQLTGNPVLLPKFAFYEGHLNAYNRDYWKETDDTNRGILFEDGKRYTESQKDNGGIKESLNGEKDNYQFSARAVIDRYLNADMPLGWVLPNDGYGAGYGQTSTLDGNIANLKSFGDYARKKGVEIGLWTQSNLHPIDSIPALLQRDIVKEVRDAGVRVLKTDVAWVGAGYSFGLNGIADVGQIMPYYGSDARPFIITLDGWAGTQRYAGVWTGDQKGGEWEYIRFHVPTYIGAGLSGMSNITSDMDGIFGGKNMEVNIRDFQWKAFTPMQLNMDGWGANPKYPQALGEPATSINRNYLKLKAAMLPYTYSCAYEAVAGQPLIRAMFLDYPSDFTHSAATKYQYMYGPSMLVAPIYQPTQADAQGNDIRNGIYLPEGQWIDYFTGDVYEGGRILNNFDAPIWKLPLFVKAGAIVPMNRPNNNIYEVNTAERIFDIWPAGHSEFTLYDDDGNTEAYLRGEHATTKVTSELDAKGNLAITICPTEGNYDGMVKEKSTLVRINTTARPKSVRAIIGKKKVTLTEGEGANTWRYVERPQLNQFSTQGTDMAKVEVTKNPVIEVNLAKGDIMTDETTIEVKGFVYDKPATRMLTNHGTLSAPVATDTKVAPYTLTPTWKAVDNADYYEIRFNSMIYSTIRNNSLLFEDLQPGTDYTFELRAVNADGHSEWTTINAKTDKNPLEFAVHGITATNTAKDMPGFGIHRLFDFQESGDIWHTHYSEKAVPFTVTMDLHATITLDKMQYVPRADAGNGTILEADIFTSKDGKTWQAVGTQKWERTPAKKNVTFTDHQQARYIRMDVKKALGDFGSGAELYVFRQPGTKVLIPGDVNQDGKIDENDLTSYMNYTGLKKGDSDFDGYISNGDINGNGLIDAYDISNVATLLEGGVTEKDMRQPAGTITYTYNKAAYQAGDEVTVTVKGTGLQAVNALSLVMPYDLKTMQYTKTDPVAVKDMRNMTYDRHHTDGSQVLYPTFVNIGQQPTIEGSATLFVIHFKALRAFRAPKASAKGMLVSNNLLETELK